MDRRRYLIAGGSAIALAACVSGEPGNNTGQPADDDNGETQDQNGNDNSDNDDQNEPNPVGYVPDSAIHQWAFLQRDDQTVTDTIGTADGDASAELTTVSGEWQGGFAELAPQETIEYIDLGYLDTVNEALDRRQLSLMATIHPTEIVDYTSMTIFGAGGGGTDWFEFRLGDSSGGRSGQPMILIRDTLGNELSVAMTESIQPNTTRRVAFSLNGSSSGDIVFWLDGERAETETIQDDGLEMHIEPEQSYGIFASNPQSPGDIETRRGFPGVIDNVILCDEPILHQEAREDHYRQPWS